MTDRSGAAATPAADVVLRVRDVSKSFPGTRALDGAGIEARAGETLALMGGNGSGKSTMMKILAGVYSADSGELEIRGQRHDLRHFSPSQAQQCGLHMVHQHRTTFNDLTVMENLAIGRGFQTAGTRIRWSAARRRAQELIDRFGIQARPDDAVGDLRPAAQTMLEIARALQDQEGASDGILALDEPTAALPPHEVEVLLSALKRYVAAGQAVLFVSHRLDEVMEIADRVTVLRDGRVVGTRAAADLTRDGLVEMMVGRVVVPPAPSAASTVEDDREPVVRVRGLVGGAVRGVDCELRAGEIVGVAGLAGSGRSTLLRLLFGAQRAEAGTIELTGAPLRAKAPVDAIAAGVALVPEDRARDAVFPDLAIIDNFTLPSTRAYTRLGWVRRAAERAATAIAIREFFVRAASPAVEISSLSGGNQQKVSIARWLSRRPRLLLLDEPTQGVDVGARAELWELIGQAARDGTAILLVSSDLEELIHLSQRIVVMRAGRIVGALDADSISSERVNHMLHELQVAA